MARPERFELPTNWFEASYSIQLSYGRVDRRLYTLSEKGSLPLDLTSNRDRLYFKTRVKQQSSYSDNCPSWIFLSKISAVHAIKSILVGNVRTEDLYINKVIHGHASFFHGRLDGVEQDAGFFGSAVRDLTIH